MGGRWYNYNELIGRIIQLEVEITKFYKSLVESMEKNEMNEFLKELINTHSERAKELQNIFRTTTVEMTLEPIIGVDVEGVSDYIKKLLEKRDLRSVGEIERRLQDFYQEVSSKIFHVSGDTSMPVSYTHLTLPTTERV